MRDKGGLVDVPGDATTSAPVVCSEAWCLLCSGTEDPGSSELSNCGSAPRADALLVCVRS